MFIQIGDTQSNLLNNDLYISHEFIVTLLPRHTLLNNAIVDLNVDVPPFKDFAIRNVHCKHILE